MPAVTLKAHFDGKRILLDEPYDVPRDAELMMTVLPLAIQSERAQWAQAASSGLVRACGSDEPAYSLDDVRPWTRAT